MADEFIPPGRGGGYAPGPLGTTAASETGGGGGGGNGGAHSRLSDDPPGSAGPYGGGGGGSLYSGFGTVQPCRSYTEEEWAKREAANARPEVTNADILARLERIEALLTKLVKKG